MLTAPDRSLFQGIIDFLAEPVFVKDDQHRIVLANQAFYEIFGVDPEDALGSTLAEAVPDGEREHFLRVDRAVLETGVPDLREEELTVAGETRIIVTSKRRYTTGDGSVYLIGSIQDVTAYKDVQKRLETKSARLEAALEEIKTLQGTLPICSYCNSIREDSGSWRRLEAYISEHSDASFSHGICDTCMRKHFPGM